jgi:hypothetical protein
MENTHRRQTYPVDKRCGTLQAVLDARLESGHQVGDVKAVPVFRTAVEKD